MNASLAVMGTRIAAHLRARGETVAITESATGGLINAALVAVPGASAWYLGGSIIYTAAGRVALHGLSAGDLNGVRPSTQAYARLLASRMRAQLGATWGLAETGAAGPTGSRYGDPAGHACIAVSGPFEDALTIETGATDREANMWAFAREAIAFLDRCIERAG